MSDDEKDMEEDEKENGKDVDVQDDDGFLLVPESLTKTNSKAVFVKDSVTDEKTIIILFVNILSILLLIFLHVFLFVRQGFAWKKSYRYYTTVC